MSNIFIGRRDSVGFGIEATAGTAVAPQVWEKQLKLTLDQKTTVQKDTSALGRIEDVHDSAVTEEWADGSLNGRIHDLSVGYLLLNMFGTCAAAAHPSETVVYDNTFTVLQTAPPPSLTFTRLNPNVTGRYAMGTQTDFQIDATSGGFVEYTSTIVSKVRATSSDTATYVAQNGFTSKHVVVKLANNVSGLTGATALQLKSVKLKISRKADRFTPLGQIDPASFDPEAFSVSGEIVLRYTDTTLEALGLGNTLQAMSIAITNTDTTIGTGSNPALVFTAPQTKLMPITLDNNLDQTMNQTIAFNCELSTSVGYMLQAVLTNTQNGYAHA